MALDPEKALFGWLQADTALAPLMHTHASAIAFFESAIPQGHKLRELPSGVIDSPTLDENDDDSTDSYRDIDMNIRLYHRPDGSSLPLRNAGEQVRARLKSMINQLIDGALYTARSVSGPTRSPTSDTSVNGVLIQVSLHIKEP